MERVEQRGSDLEDKRRRRHLTVLFSDLSGSTRLGERMDAEHFAEMLGSVRSLCRTVIAEHGGQIARIQSDGLVAIFGYDGVQEDDGRRAAEAALDLHRSVNRVSFSGALESGEVLTLHSGIHAGVCFVDRGDFERGRFEVLGDVPNLAARLADLAGPGELCISDETLGPDANLFEIRERREVNVKGRASPISVCMVLGRAAARTRFEAGAARGFAPFVGREMEAQSLKSHLASALHGTPHCVTVVGSPGVGKTRLLEELARHVPTEQGVVLRGYCESYLSAEPLQPFLQILRSVGSSSSRMLDDESAMPSLDPSLAVRRAFHAASTLLRSTEESSIGGPGAAVDVLRNAFDALAAELPVLLIVDDWQWADDTSARVVDAIRRLNRPILVLLAMREPEPGQLNAMLGPTLRLAPLSLDAVTRSVRHLVPSADPFLIADIHRDSGGNPLFVEELCHSAALRNAAHRSHRPYERSAWLASLIESRVARLSASDGRMVRVASVIGNVFPRWLLGTASGMALHDEQVNALASQDFIYPADHGDLLRFKHGVTREVVYASVGLRERIAIHVDVARALEAHAADASREDIVEALAYHYAEGMLPAQAADFAELAGDKAMGAHALDRARLQYGAALMALDKVFVSDRAFLLRWCAVAQKLGMACVFDALALTDAAKLLTRGVELARQSGDLAAIARAEYWLGYIYYAKGRGREAMQHCQAAMECADRLGDTRLLAQLRATLGQICASVCRYDESLTLLDAAIDSKRALCKPGSSVAVGSAFALAIRGSVLGDQGDFTAAEECFADMMRLLEGSTHQVVSSVRNWMGVVYLWQGRWADAAAVVEASMHVAENVKSHLLLAISKSIWGYGNWRRAGTAEALQAVRDGTNWIELRGGSLGSSLNYGWLLDMTETIGSDSERRRHAAILLQRARQHDRLGTAMGRRALARAAAKAQDLRAAERHLVHAEQTARDRGSRHEHAATLLCRAEVSVLTGNPRVALAPLDAASEAFASMKMAWHSAQAEALRRLL